MRPEHESWLRDLLADAPLEKAMSILVFGSLVTASTSFEPLQSSPAATAGAYLLFDDLERAHIACQDLGTPEVALWHAIVHRREGDFWNSKYWLRQAGSATKILGDPFALVDDVESARGSDLPELVERQRVEWLTLMRHCLTEAASVETPRK